MSAEQKYQDTADLLVARIVALAPKHPEIMALDSAWELFRVPGFKCDDLRPSLAQAQWALAKAQQICQQESR